MGYGFFKKKKHKKKKNKKRLSYSKQKHAIYCPDTDETVYYYKDYLKSKHWNNVRNKFLAVEINKKCYSCGDANNIEVHHESYTFIGKEIDEYGFFRGLKSFCRQCHAYLHRNHKIPVSTKTIKPEKKKVFILRMKKSRKEAQEELIANWIRLCS